MKITFSKKKENQIFLKNNHSTHIQRKKRYLHAVPNSENSRFKSPPDIKARQHLKKSNSRRLF